MKAKGLRNMQRKWKFIAQKKTERRAEEKFVKKLSSSECSTNGSSSNLPTDLIEKKYSRPLTPRSFHIHIIAAAAATQLPSSYCVQNASLRLEVMKNKNANFYSTILDVCMWNCTEKYLNHIWLCTLIGTRDNGREYPQHLRTCELLPLHFCAVQHIKGQQWEMQSAWPYVRHLKKYGNAPLLSARYHDRCNWKTNIFHRY